MKISKSDIKLINEAILIEKKYRNIDFPELISAVQIEKLSKDELLFICSSLTNKLTIKDNYYSDDLISRILVFLERRGDMDK